MFQNCQVPLTGFVVFSGHLSIFWVWGSCWGLYLLRLVYWYFCEIETKGKNKSVGISKYVWTPIGSVCTEAAGEETADSPPKCSRDRGKWAERRKPRNGRKQRGLPSRNRCQWGQCRCPEKRKRKENARLLLSGLERNVSFSEIGCPPASPPHPAHQWPEMSSRIPGPCSHIPGTRSAC